MSGAARALGLVEPNDAERRYATEITVDGWRNPEALAELLAFVREGGTLEGPRRLVGGHAEISRRALTGPDAERAIESATEFAWRSWFRELHRGGLRPCGWPAVERTHLRFGMLSRHEPEYVEVDDLESADLLMLSVTCEAVPA